MISTEESLPHASPAAAPRRRRWLTVLLWLLIAPFAVWAAARVFGLERGYPTIQLIAFTPYVAVVSLVPLALAVLTKRIWPAVAAAVVAVAFAACVLPRWIADSDAGVPAGPTLRVMTVNTLYGQADPDQIVRLVRDGAVDLLAVQEYTEEGRTALRAAGLEETLPDAVTYPRAGGGGSAVYSRFPLADKGYRQLPGGFMQAHARVQVPGAPEVYVESAHPCAPMGRASDACWLADLAAQPAATPTGPVNLLMGDFNSTLDHKAFRRVLAKGYHDAADLAGAGLSASWPYDNRWYYPSVTLDHILADERVGVRKVVVHRVAGSDHRAVFAEVVLPKAGG
ncbi:endonuclease/exonuclease/phosphatase family protein [Dactylosporangium sp. AC04546]|uniref:endonuclease/exonuclease/phosphatase family protein n=1 Tax=Dactylosporangium sp. AC04546 TaxID=2862460 RepID=UPI001EE12285|nr:endonuclease/exonuclease/phosphatase family protein [Dactylosporangium sp. AC04546]WVK85931.1 endonuclease/exonuclease/phosphatase family protein [Dactylosporangium sp. AC04546]